MFLKLMCPVGAAPWISSVSIGYLISWERVSTSSWVGAGGGTDDVVSFEVRSQEHSCSTKPHNELSKTQQLVVRLRLWCLHVCLCRSHHLHTRESASSVLHAFTLSAQQGFHFPPDGPRAGHQKVKREQTFEPNLVKFIKSGISTLVDHHLQTLQHTL